MRLGIHSTPPPSRLNHCTSRARIIIGLRDKKVRAFFNIIFFKTFLRKTYRCSASKGHCKWCEETESDHKHLPTQWQQRVHRMSAAILYRVPLTTSHGWSTRGHSAQVRLQRLWIVVEASWQCTSTSTEDTWHALWGALCNNFVTWNCGLFLLGLRGQCQADASAENVLAGEERWSTGRNNESRKVVEEDQEGSNIIRLERYRVLKKIFYSYSNTKMNAIQSVIWVGSIWRGYLLMRCLSSAH